MMEWKKDGEWKGTWREDNKGGGKGAKAQASVSSLLGVHRKQRKREPVLS